jgi:hypothetical protein
MKRRLRGGGREVVRGRKRRSCPSPSLKSQDDFEGKRGENIFTAILP